MFQDLGSAGGDPENLHPEWLFQLVTLAGGKPIAVSETGFAAQDLVLPGLFTVPANEAWQAEFAWRLLVEAHVFELRYLVWFTARDFDPLWTNCLGGDDLSLIWRDTGLSDEFGTGRPGLDIWRALLAHPPAE